MEVHVYLRKYVFMERNYIRNKILAQPSSWLIRDNMRRHIYNMGPLYLSIIDEQFHIKFNEGITIEWVMNTAHICMRSSEGLLGELYVVDSGQP